ncbi:MAG TPA: fluoride efflux transporter CrcB [Micavibrio sp.]|nr:fluoride efflux transporter CrcB [Micavibrio sp.]HIL29256.1 fluoride efflux transporter CrcB [Micavibrio sp.]
MQMILAIAAGGAVGAVLRHYLNSFAAALLGTGFPYGIFAANILGSFLMGVLIVYFALAGEGTQTMKASFLTVGLLGAFTTFSTFSLDAALMIERGQLITAGLYIGGSVVLAIGGLFLGMAITRIFLA